MIRYDSTCFLDQHLVKVTGSKHEGVRRETTGNRRQAFAECAALVRQCGRDGDLCMGRTLHLEIIANRWEHVTYLCNLLVEMYGSCSSVVDAMAVFEKMERPNVVSWTLIIAANARNGYSADALKLFWRMLLEGVKPDVVAWVGILNVCAGLGDTSLAREIHGLVEEAGFSSGTVVGNALMNMYRQCGEPTRTEQVFYTMHETDVISWTSMMTAYAQKGLYRNAVELLRRMDVEGVKPNCVTFIILVDAISGMPSRMLGKMIHARLAASGFDSSVTVSNSLIHMYSKCGDLQSAICVFERMPEKNTVSWTSMLAAFTANEHPEEALRLFHLMDLEGVKGDVITLVTAVDACASRMVLSQARAFHGRATDSGHLHSNIILANAVINMYGNCGSLENARAVFGCMKSRNVITWSVVIMMHARNGEWKRGLEYFELMNLDGVLPNSSTFTGVLFACSHGGGVSYCRDYFMSMGRDYGVAATLDHYSAIVDVLGRGGMVERAEELIRSIPLEADSVMRLAYLSACCMHEEVEQGRVVAKAMVELAPGKDSPYVILSNIFAFDESSAIIKIKK